MLRYHIVSLAVCPCDVCSRRLAAAVTRALAGEPCLLSACLPGSRTCQVGLVVRHQPSARSGVPRCPSRLVCSVITDGRGVGRQAGLRRGSFCITTTTAFLRRVYLLALIDSRQWNNRIVRTASYSQHNAVHSSSSVGVCRPTYVACKRRSTSEEIRVG